VNKYKIFALAIFLMLFMNTSNTFCMFIHVDEDDIEEINRSMSETLENAQEAEDELETAKQEATRAAHNLRIEIAGGVEDGAQLRIEIAVEEAQKELESLLSAIDYIKSEKASLEDHLIELNETQLFKKAEQAGIDEEKIGHLKHITEIIKEKVQNLTDQIIEIIRSRNYLQETISSAEKELSTIIIPELLEEMKKRTKPIQFEKTYGIRCSISCGNVSLANLIAFYPCAHVIHKECLLRYNKARAFGIKCPLCRKKIKKLEYAAKVPVLKKKILRALKRKAKKRKRKKRTLNQDPSQDDDDEDKENGRTKKRKRDTEDPDQYEPSAKRQKTE